MTEVLERNATAPAVKSDMPAVSPQPPRLLDQMRERIRVKHYSLSTEKTYIYWVRFFIRWSGMQHPRDMGAAEVEGFLSFLATQRDVSAGTQNQAMHAILFLYKEVIGVTLPWLDGITRAKPSKRLPVVLTVAETQRLLAATRGTPGLVVRLLYGTGMRLMEGLRLRVKDIDFDRRQITIRAGKGDNDRVTMLPGSLVEPLRAHLAERRRWHRRQGRRAGLESAARAQIRIEPPALHAVENHPARRAGEARFLGTPPIFLGINRLSHRFTVVFSTFQISRQYKSAI